MVLGYSHNVSLNYLSFSTSDTKTQFLRDRKKQGVSFCCCTGFECQLVDFLCFMLTFSCNTTFLSYCYFNRQHMIKSEKPRNRLQKELRNLMKEGKRSSLVCNAKRVKAKLLVFRLSLKLRFLHLIKFP